MRRQISPRTIRDSPKRECANYLHKLAMRQGENREDSASFTHVFYHTFDPLSIAFWKILKKFFLRAPLRQDLRHQWKSLLSFVEIGLFLENFCRCVSFCTNFFTKNRWFWTIYIFQKIVYNNNAVGGTNSTASRTTSYRSCEASILWSQCAGFPQLCLF